ncbi:MAG: carbohydrate ABC transporter permease [Candidatus Limiplasma sp.]|nr:carbohydrate ABC transporter permease [Candidatus Limiplasma sp.]
MDKHVPLWVKVLIYAFFLTGVVMVGFPLVYAFFGSFKSSVEFLSGSSGLLPSQWHWENYATAWNLSNFGVYTLNSVRFSLGAVLGTLITTTLTAYVLSRSNIKLKKPLVSSFGITLFVSGAITLFPIFKLCSDLGLTSSLWGMTLAQVAVSQPIYCILALSYFDGISREIDEAARIDGCGFFRIYWNILLPVSKPIIATVAILAFRDAWNNYMMPLAFTLSKPELRPLTVGVVALKDQGEGISSWNLMIAGTIMSLLPIIIFYLFFNRYFISGIMDGAIKG